MISTTGNTAIEAVNRRVQDKAFRDINGSNTAVSPIALNNEAVTVLNAAGTGVVEVFRVNASDKVVMTPGVTSLTALTTNGAISPTVSANYVITKAGVLADTLAAPTADGVNIEITSGTANAHTLTATGLLQTGSAAVNVATYAAFAGASLRLRSFNGKWLVLAAVGITFS